MAARNRIDSRIISAAMAFFLGTVGTVANAQSRTGSAPGFRVEIEQDGRPVPIRNHELTIPRTPFDIVLYFPKSGGGVALRSATQSALYDLAKSGKPLGKVFKPVQTIAEEDFDKDEDFILDDPTGQNFWSYDPADPGHRFSEVLPTPNGFKCRRRISTYFLNDKHSPVASTDFRAIYLVFHNGQSARDFMSSNEGDREYLKISFSPPSKASIGAGATPDSVFHVALERLAEPVPIRNHEARLRKAPFDGLVDLKGIDGVYVHASFDNSAYAPASHGEPLGKSFKRLQTMAVSFFNPQNVVMINNERSHDFWAYLDRTHHSFNWIDPLPGGAFEESASLPTRGLMAIGSRFSA